MFFVDHVQGFIHAVVEKRILLDTLFERETMQQVGMEQERPTGNRHPLAIILFTANLSGSHAEQRTFVIIVFAATIVQIHIGIVPKEQPIHTVIVQAVAYGRNLVIVNDADQRVLVGASEVAAVIIDIPNFQYLAHLVSC